MTVQTPDYLQRLIDAVGAFERAFEEWMATQVESDHLASRGMLPTVWQREGMEESVVRRLELRVAELAGSAAGAVTVTGAFVKVQGLGVIDPIANWSMMSSPKALFTPRDIRRTAATVRGRLSAMLTDALARTGSDTPGFAPSELHPIIWSAAAAHWTTHQYRVAVREAAEALNLHWKARLGRSDVNDTVFWQESLSPGDPQHGRPKLVWPGDAADRTVRSFRGGLEPLARSLNGLAVGLNLTVRNVATHTRKELSEQEALERLASYSFLARLLDQCGVQRAPSDQA